MSYNKIEGLYCVIDSSWVDLKDAGRVSCGLVEAGVRIIQLRAKESGSADLLEAARAMRSATDGRALFIVNDRIDVAILSGADGVHLGQDDIPLTEARKLMPSALIGISTHNLDEARRAERDGADYISFGPIFQTKTKKDADVPKGIEGIKALDQVSLPVVAIGGITSGNAVSVLAAGASSVAVISDILSSGDPRERAALISALIAPVLKERHDGQKDR